MLIPIRKTAAGIEYWDSEEKRVVVGGVDLASSEDTTAVANKSSNEEVLNFSEMTVAQLKQFAAENNIDIPSDVKNKQDLITFLIEATK
jgi:hypothetical protein